MRGGFWLETGRAASICKDVAFPALTATRCPWIVALLPIIAPVVAFFLILDRDVRLVPLVGMDIACAECDRKATRTIKSAADALRVKGIYFYDRSKYPKTAPAWCDQHGPDRAPENMIKAYFGAIAVFVVTALLYKRLTSGEIGS